MLSATTMSASVPPTHIALPPPPSWPDNFRLSPNNQNTPFFTPPSSPASPSLYFTPPSSPLVDSSPSVPPSLQTDDAFPPPVDHNAIDFALDDDGLSTLEKIYLYSRSRATFHRVFIAHALPEYLLQVTPQEAVEYVLPLLSGLAMDEGASPILVPSSFFSLRSSRRACQRGSGSRVGLHYLVVFHGDSFPHFMHILIANVFPSLLVFC